MEYIPDIMQIYINISSDKRVNVWHIGIYMALIYCWANSEFSSPFTISRSMIMRMAHIGSIATYHKFITQLQEFGYIDYMPSFNPLTGSKVNIIT